MIKTKVAILTTLTMALGTSYVAYAETGDTKDFVIYHTNDTHSRVDVFPAVATLVKETQADGSNVLYFDAGDTFHGQPIATTVKGESVANILNVTPINAMTTGNHDYDYGLERLIELSDMLNFPIVASNVYYKGTDEHIFNDYYIFEVDGVKVGVFGLATPETYTKTNPNNVVNVEFADPTKEAERVTKLLKDEGCDVVVSLAHLGIDESTVENLRSTYVAENVDDIDIMIDGHSHSLIENGVMAGDTLVVQTGEYGNNVGKISFDIENGEVVNLGAELIPMKDAEGKATVESDAEVQAVIDEAKAAVAVVNDEVIGETPYALEGTREIVRSQETNLGDLITASMIDATGADVAITNGGGIRATIDAGDITKGEVVTVLPFGNFLVTETVTGQQILDALEHGYSSVGEPAGFFPHIGGMSVVVDPSREVGSRVVKATLDNGEALNPKKEYTLATNDFIVAGGDGYEMLSGKKDYREWNALDEALIDYINSGSAVITEGPQGRIVISEQPVVEPENPVTPSEKVEVYNSETSNVKPVVIGGKTYLPVRAFVEDVLGGKVVYNPATSVVTAKVSYGELTFNAESDSTVQFSKGKTYLPIREVCEDLGMEVNWDTKTGIIKVYANK